MMNCWAQCLNFSVSRWLHNEDLARAHRAGELLPWAENQVSGFPWSDGKELDVGLGSLVKKHLCTEHNSKLSPLDCWIRLPVISFGCSEACGPSTIHQNRARSPMKEFRRPCRRGC